MLRKLTPIVAILIAFPLLAVAQAIQEKPTTPESISPEKRALVAELLRVTGSRKQTEDVFNTMLAESEKQMPEITWAAISESPLIAELTDKEREELRSKTAESAIATSQRFRELFSERLDFAKLDEITTDLYAKYFSEAEISDLIQFYKSTTGQRTMQLMPQMLAEAMQRSQEIMMPIIKEVMHEVSTEQTQKFEKEITAIVESHHRVKKPGATKRRPQ